MRLHAAPMVWLGFLASTGCNPPPVAAPHEPGPGCTEEARVCPDGSHVVRVGSDCEFEKCPADPDNGLSPDPSPAADGSGPKPMGTFDPQSPPG